MEAEELAFLMFWTREVEENKIALLGRMLGVNFTAGEIRSWSSEEGGNKDYRDKDNVLVPLSLIVRPDLKESLIKMVGGRAMPLPKGYRKGKNEMVVDLGRVSPEEFIEFVKNKTPPKLPDYQNES